MRDTWPASNLAFFFGQVALLCLLYLPCAFFVVLNAQERLQIVNACACRVSSPDTAPHESAVEKIL